MPKSFSICTVKAPDDAGAAAGRVHAAVFTQQMGTKGGTVLSIFVQGPQAETTEGALRALLDKTEAMIGKRWRVAMDRRHFLAD